MFAIYSLKKGSLLGLGVMVRAKVIGLVLNFIMNSEPIFIFVSPELVHDET